MVDRGGAVRGGAVRGGAVRGGAARRVGADERRETGSSERQGVDDRVAEGLPESHGPMSSILPFQIQAGFKYVSWGIDSDH